VVLIALSDLVDIQMGYSFRGGVAHDPSAPVAVVQMKDLGDDGLVDFSALARVSMDVRADQLLREGDIIFRSRGDRATCAMVASGPGRALVAAPLLILRVRDSQRVLPAYLTWSINQPPAQAYLAKRAEGSNVKMITIATLGGLPVEVPSVGHQRVVVELAGLSARERILEARVSAARERLVAGLLLNYARGGAAE
jgi:hypothetical protein